MNEKASDRSGRQPPISARKYRTRRSNSISNDLEREPILLSSCRRERKSSTSTDLDPPKMIINEKPSRVSELREHFEKRALAYNNQSNVKIRNLLTQATRCPSAPVSSNTKIFSSVRSARRILPSKQDTNCEELTVITSIHISSDSLSTENDSNNTFDKINNKTQFDDSLEASPAKSEITSSTNLMTGLTQRPLSLTGIFIPSQSNEIIDSPNDDSRPYNDTLPNDEDEDMETKRKSELFEPLTEIMKEIHATEVTYVKKLYVLSVKIPSEIKESCEKDENLIKTFDNTYRPLCNAIQKLYQFHNEIILPRLEEYITEHRKDNIWSIFQDHYQTIEGLYKAYYVAYAENQTKLDNLCTSHPSIYQAMLKCRVYLDNLYPIDELNCANQRLLRYILLMKSFMKKLDENLSEYKHTRFIHDELTRIAERCEEHLAVSSAQLNKLKERVDSKPECFDSQRLVWHGSVKKQSPRKRTDVAQRYLILFSKCILVYKESGNKLEIKRQLSIKDITIDILESRPLEPLTTNQQTNMINYYPFRVNAVEKSYEFLVDKEIDREKWVNKIRQTTEEFKRGISPIAIRHSSRRTTEEKYGNRAPAWVSDKDVSRCQICNNGFRTNIILSRRHHCRSCGRCICGSCSTRKLTLKYCIKDGEQRVCDTCYTHFTGLKKTISSPTITRDPNKSILFGDFHSTSPNSILWLDLTEDFQLYIYSAKLDQVADYSIYLPHIRRIVFTKETQLFTLYGKDKTFKLYLEDTHQLTYQKNDYIDETIKNTSNKKLYYANLWHDTMQMAHMKTLPSWYIRKRDSADSGISDNA